MRFLILLFTVVNTLFSAQIMESIWKSGEAFSIYLEKNGIPQSLIKSIPADDLQYVSEIQAGIKFYELKEGNKLLQALIPVGEEMQIHIFKDTKNERYHFDIIPVAYREVRDTVCISLSNTLFEDMTKYTNNPRLGYLLKKYYRKTVDFRKLRKGDKISFVYRQKSRLGKPYGSPKIKAAVIKTRGKYNFIFADKGGVYYDDVNKKVSYTVDKIVKVSDRNTFLKPVKRMRITSKFTYKRWHPIKHKYRPHLGVDIGAKRGTKIYATYSGKVIYAGWMGGYGKVVKISHPKGYVSLYAHQSRLAVKKGQYVKRGQVIGYIGNTGRSTGPHLHFGLYKNHKAVNPMKYIGKVSIGKKVSRVKKISKYKIVPIKGAKRDKKRVLNALKSDIDIYKWESYKQPFDMIEERSKYEK